jgi:putative transposase
MVGYSLMANHTHNVSIFSTKMSLAKGFGRAQNDLSQWRNIRRNRVVNLWQSRFFPFALDEDHFWKVLRYIELNAVRAGLVGHAREWPWSSTPAHISGRESGGLRNLELWKGRFGGKHWQEFLEEGLEASEEQEEVRSATRIGWPLGAEEL